MAKNTGKMAKNTGKVREFCQSGKVGTLIKLIAVNPFIMIVYSRFLFIASQISGVLIYFILTRRFPEYFRNLGSTVAENG